MAVSVSQEMVLLAREWERIGRHLDEVQSGAIDLTPSDSHSLAMELLLASDVVMRHKASTIDDVRLKYYILRAVTGRRELPLVRFIVGDGQCDWIATMMQEAWVLGLRLGEFWLAGREREVDFDGAREPDVWKPLASLGLLECPAG